MRDISRELSAFFDDRYPNNARRISSAVELPNNWVLAESFERRRDNRGGAYTSYYATRVKSRVLVGEERAHTGNHYELEYPTHPRAQAQLQSWFDAFYNEELE
jgi:hypothetical protein